MEGTSCTIPSTHATGDATLNGLLADADNLSFYAFDVQGIGYFCESRIPLINRTFINNLIFYGAL